MKSKSVRVYKPEDAAALVGIHNLSFPGNQMRPNSFARYLSDIIGIEGQVWTVSDGQGLVGYASVAPVPALDGVFDLQGCTDPAKRRQGFGSCLLEAIVTALKETGNYQLSHAVYTLSSPAALFLKKHQFFVEHVEWQLLLENPDKFPTVTFPPGFRLTTYQVATAVRTFRKLYDDIFRGLPWYQPYTSTREVINDLDDSADLFFLLDGEQIVGFVWLRMPEPDLGEIEPFGLLPTYQGQGLGAKFLMAGIQKLVARGTDNVRIGAWQRNERAVRLYQKLGFKHVKTQIYLALDITGSQVINPSAL